MLTSQASGTTASIKAGTGTPSIGYFYTGSTSFYFPGYIDEFRISNIARWTSDFNVNLPSNLIAVAGDAQVTLSWDAVSGAIGYNIKRATTSGGSLYDDCYQCIC